ncbi:MAG: PilT/PilU family type 4a pilus ATPase [Myxococcales bacterium]
MALEIASPARQPEPWVAQLLQAVVAARASDLHLRVGSPPYLRVDGLLARTNAAALTVQSIETVLAQTADRRPPPNQLAWEYSCEIPGVGRFRCHAFREDGRLALTMRVVPQRVPTFAELRLPPLVKTLADGSPGLVLITGPTGSGKSTTAAAILQYLTTQETRHLVTLEDPIEHRIADVPSCVSQREVGRDCTSFSDGLRAMLREDPDVLFISEIRDMEALEAGLQAAEAGHLVVSTFHTASVLKTIQRIVAMFPSEEQAAARARLADVLRGVLSQRLLPRKGTRGRILCVESMLNNYAIKECIRDAGRVASIQATLERSGDQQMQSFDQCLVGLVREGLVAADVALAHAHAPTELRRLLSFPGLT